MSFGGGRLQWPITSDLAALRAHVHAFGLRAGLGRQRAQDLVIVANEAATNVLDHGGGSGTLTALSDPAGVRLEVTDSSGTLSQAQLTPELARHPRRGVGLWLIRQLCDEVRLEIASGSARLHLYLRHRAPETV